MQGMKQPVMTRGQKLKTALRAINRFQSPRAGLSCEALRRGGLSPNEEAVHVRRVLKSGSAEQIAMVLSERPRALLEAGPDVPFREMPLQPSLSREDVRKALVERFAGNHRFAGAVRYGIWVGGVVMGVLAYAVISLAVGSTVPINLDSPIRKGSLKRRIRHLDRTGCKVETLRAEMERKGLLTDELKEVFNGITIGISTQTLELQVKRMENLWK